MLISTIEMAKDLAFAYKDIYVGSWRLLSLYMSHLCYLANRYCSDGKSTPNSNIPVKFINLTKYEK